MSSKSLPSVITSYDLLKTFAVIIMVVDHMGLYFFPDDNWWRSVGRIGFPVWFFLLGHASGRGIPHKLLGGVVVLILASLLVGMPILPLNALITIIVIRLLIDRVMGVALRSAFHLWGVAALLFLLAVPTGFVSEYGTMALITAMFGYMVRHRARITDQMGNDNIVNDFMVFALVAFIILQQLSFGFSVEQFVFMAVGTALVRFRLCYFKAATYPRVTDFIGAPARFLIQLCGRRTLEIYVVHLLVFKALALYLGLEGYGFLNFSLIKVGG